jgi:hypothetical protein
VTFEEFTFEEFAFEEFAFEEFAAGRSAPRPRSAQ